MTSMRIFRADRDNKQKTGRLIGVSPKGQFSKNAADLERGMPHFCICVHKSSASYALTKDYNQLFVCLKANELARTKAPLCKGSCREATEGLF